MTCAVAHSPSALNATSPTTVLKVVLRQYSASLSSLVPPVAVTAWAGVIGRIDTTIGPRKRPAGRQATFVRYIGTLRPISRWRSGKPACSNAFSNVNEQPITKPTTVSAIQATGYRTLAENQKVEYTTTQGPKGPQAYQVHAI